MSNETQTAGRVLTQVGNAATAIAPQFGGLGSAIVGGIGGAIALVGELLSAGQDPIINITRIRREERQRIDDEVDARINGT